MPQKQPLVSILMPVYNCASTVAEAIASVQNQTLTDWQLLIIDDASTDDTAAAVEPFLSDERIHLHRGKTNKGLAERLNNLLKSAPGTYLARLDGDDMMHTGRLAAQVKFLQENPHIFAVGTALERFGTGARKIIRRPQHHSGIWAAMMFAPGLAHPSVMLQGNVVRRFSLRYPITPVTQDYGFWLTCAQSHQLKFANLRAPLTRYRMAGQNTSERQQTAKHSVMQQCHRQYLTSLALAPSEQEMACHLALATAGAPPSWQVLLVWCGKLLWRSNWPQRREICKMLLRLSVTQLTKKMRHHG